MLKEFAEFISGQAVSAAMASPQSLAVDITKDRIQVVGGKSEFVAALPASRNHQLFSLDDVANFIANVVGSGSLWYSREGVTVLVSDEERKDKAKMSLSLSPQINSLLHIESGKPAWSQAAAITNLRIQFAGCVPEGLADQIRKVKFNINTQGESEIQRAKVSVGKSTLAEFHGIDGLPEFVEFNVPVFASRFASIQSVRVAIDPDPSNSTFKFVPLPGQIEAAISRAEAEFGAAIREKVADTTPVYFGVP